MLLARPSEIPMRPSSEPVVAPALRQTVRKRSGNARKQGGTENASHGPAIRNGRARLFFPLRVRGASAWRNGRVTRCLVRIGRPVKRRARSVDVDEIGRCRAAPRLEIELLTVAVEQRDLDAPSPKRLSA